jgi:hypothetical protein
MRAVKATVILTGSIGLVAGLAWLAGVSGTVDAQTVEPVAGNPTCKSLGYRYETKIECPKSGCAGTIEYWLSHSEFGPASYDPTWSQLPLGGSTPFRTWPGTSYHDVLRSSPAGDPYVALARVHIAFELNTLAGRITATAARDAWSEAGELLSLHGNRGMVPGSAVEQAHAAQLTEVLSSAQPTVSGQYVAGSTDVITVVTNDGVYFDWTSTFLISAVIVKGGASANVYGYVSGAMAGAGLSAPINVRTGEPFELSAIRFCYDERTTPTPTAQPTPTVTPTNTPTATPTVTPTNTPTVAPTTTGTPTPTVAPTNTGTPTPTVAPTNTGTPTPTVAPTNTGTPTPTVAPTTTGTPTPTVAPTTTGTPTPTVAPTNTGTPTPTVAPTNTPTPTPTRLPVASAR